MNRLGSLATAATLLFSNCDSADGQEAGKTAEKTTPKVEQTTVAGNAKAAEMVKTVTTGTNTALAGVKKEVEAGKEGPALTAGDIFKKNTFTDPEAIQSNKEAQKELTEAYAIITGLETYFGTEGAKAVFGEVNLNLAELQTKSLPEQVDLLKGLYEKLKDLPEAYATEVGIDDFYDKEDKDMTPEQRVIVKNYDEAETPVVDLDIAATKIESGQKSQVIAQENEKQAQENEKQTQENEKQAQEQAKRAKMLEEAKKALTKGK